ncbi:LysR family transcriptional regulator [Candidatus Berkiella cookevillensis]|uniref:HTH-type transcriptional regulator DmlR n=1 Tax=Candidatus Berkiella cookevillensis TaxID=437022 RepID=A0A0Q9YQE4_9GAMM|nr:LysR family transcriptional regulator [Candidatus Berkiella cookevillensis]MCS5707798.1 LysR family transcriptional regulator [Candidatus Berkiella cookevillensis]
MIDELRALAIFAKTVEAGSFRNGAKELKLSPSVVSHHISQLEERLGVTLLYRSTRSLSLTQEGEQLFFSVQKMVQAAENGLNIITQKSSEPSGKLIITVPAVLTRSSLIKDLALFAKTFPKITLSISFTDLQQDLIREGIDLAIRIGDLKNDTLKAKKLFEMKRTLIVAPSYMQSRKHPRKPQDLINWDWIGLKTRPDQRTLVNKTGKQFQINFKPRMIVDNLDAICQFATAGLGLATPPSFLVEEDIRQGLLIEPLPAWSIQSLGVYAVCPPNAAKESLTFRLINFLETRKSSL